MIIDTHGHVTGPTELYEFLRGFANVSGGAGRAIRKFPIFDDRLEEALAPHLDEITKAGIDFQLIAGPATSVLTAERRTSLVVSMAQQVNDLVAQSVHLHPDRFAGVGLLPLSVNLKPRDCIEEMERCVNELGFIGFYLNPDPAEGLNEYPHFGDEYWYPIYEKLVQFNVPGIVHGGSGRFAGVPHAEYLLQQEAVTTWGILRSPILFRDFPSLKLVIAHGGAGIPYQFGRAKGFRLNERVRGSGEDWEPFEESLRRLYFDTALLDKGSVELLIQVCGVDRCVFGTESPGIGSVMNPVTRHNFNDVKSQIDSIDWLSASDRNSIFEANVRKVFQRLPLAISGAVTS